MSNLRAGVCLTHLDIFSDWHRAWNSVSAKHMFGKLMNKPQISESPCLSHSSNQTQCCLWFILPVLEHAITEIRWHVIFCVSSKTPTTIFRVFYCQRNDKPQLAKILSVEALSHPLGPKIAQAGSCLMQAGQPLSRAKSPTFTSNMAQEIVIREKSPKGWSQP